MKSTLMLTAALVTFAVQTQAQTAAPATSPRVAADQITTKNGPLTVQPITHGSVVFTWNGKTIYVDPYGGAEAYAGLAAPDVILITDIHGDHLDPKTLAGLSVSKSLMIVPKAVAEKLPAEYKSQVRVLGNGQQLDTLGMRVSAIPMYNLPEAPDAMHTKGRGNGYVLTLGGKNVYLSGDTEDIAEMRALKNIDVAFVCMNLPYTMDVQQAAQGVLAFKPGIVYPYHYRGQNGLSDVTAFKKSVNATNKKIDVRLRNWYPAEAK
ncbi:L-ascorbate metabolism protein UlaG, beta-lactamase superfamily [Hymenobacter gelipurpurascens]|uniref:L-ascorbate metabolism protein UlaG, beta-lactamase superfamily n=1 Tax=Hymenobacter gelipurpurascens TaxID=89968 RepID=A0A212TFA6_9BACT|nr:MBL fold metallo-hydrolase [Hymenobacter gelipurpurascens]SNC64683.1 L-ascorbate metabolism protein UlaG, beta-lactamase superfamily [Hymenobacter gelipurpurascens]